MQEAIAEALSTSEVAERIWAVAPNRFCADCGAAQPDWASINLCVVICKRCAGVSGGGALGQGMTELVCLVAGGLSGWRDWSEDSSQRLFKMHLCAKPLPLGLQGRHLTSHIIGGALRHRQGK